ncbi:MAG: universal stress protein [Thermodesulfobacteriota bacterium]|nr:universal stress protein [Thermodesulfobacteriota bacterium]
MKIKKLLFATQLEELWFDALQSLMDLRKADLNHVVFLNVIERDKVAMRRGTGYQKGEEIKLREMVNVRFIDWAETLFEQGMEVGAYIVVGNLVQQIIQAVQKEEVDLVVMGHRKKTKLEILFSGSDIAELIRRTSAPVLLYKYMLDSSDKIRAPFKTPLLATDWSAASHKAAEYLLGLKNVIKTIRIIHVAEDKQLNGLTAMEVQRFRKENGKKLEEVCEMFESQGIKAKSHFYIGDTADEIEKAAQEFRASMIVMGATGKGALRERWLGSVPMELAEKSAFPTLLVPSKVSGN